MANKQLKFRSEAREKILRGAGAMADAIRITIGPRSKCVLIEKSCGKPLVRDDGVTIAKEIQFKDPEENLGAQMLREAAERTGDAVENAVSVAGVLLLTEATLTEIPEPKEHGPGMGGGGFPAE